MRTIQEVSTFQDLMESVHSRVKEIIVTRGILCLYSVILGEKVTLRGKEQENGEPPHVSFPYGDGIGLSAGACVRDLVINAPVGHKGIYLAAEQGDLGLLRFENITMTGQFSLIFRQGVRRASVSIHGLDVIAADSRRYQEQPRKYGVNVLQGAFTVYNCGNAPDSVVRMTADGLRIGRKNAPVTGSGLFVAGFGDAGGRVEVDQLRTGAVYSTGKIPLGAPDCISAAVFILHGARARSIVHDGELVTYGFNDMVLDAWGEVEEWTCNGPVISYGPGGMGFVNFGRVGRLAVHAPLETYGLGAGGYNQHDGAIEEAIFDSITTYGDGSAGIQISRKTGSITVLNDITTHGGAGDSPVDGEQVRLAASALCVTSGGEARSIRVMGAMQAFGDGSTAYTVEDGGIVHELEVNGKPAANGRGAR